MEGNPRTNFWGQCCTSSPFRAITRSCDNAAQVSPALAEKLGLSTGEVIELTLQGRSLRVPVWVMPGQARHTVSLALGYGRSRAGQAGDGVGFNASSLRASGNWWSAN